MAQALRFVSDWTRSEQGWTKVFMGDFLAVFFEDLHDAANNSTDKAVIR